jgi:hypothetical protein
MNEPVDQELVVVQENGRGRCYRHLSIVPQGRTTDRTSEPQRVEMDVYDRLQDCGRATGT